MSCADFFSDRATINRAWYRQSNLPSSGPSDWTNILSRTVDGARGLALSVAANEEYRGRLALRVGYTDRNAQVFECDFQQQTTVWVPGNAFQLQARVEAPIDSGITNGGIAPLTDYPFGELGLSISCYREITATQRSLVRTYTFANPLASETLYIPIPRGAFAFTYFRTDLTVTPSNIARAEAVWVRAPGSLPGTEPLADYTDLMNSATNGGTFRAGVPTGASLIQITGGTSPNPIVHTLAFDIQV